MTHRDRILAGAAFLFLAGCATTSAATGDTSVTGASPLTITEEPVSLKTPTGEVFGTLELPAARTPVPVALIIAGSGPTDRNGNSPALPGANNSLKMLAHGLAARGIASARYDKRGIAASRAAITGEQDLRFTNFIEDAEAWVKQLRADTRFSTVTIIGHSEGSLIGMVAAREAGADAYVSLEGTGRKAADILAEQLKPQLPPETFAQSKAIMDQLSSGTIPDPPRVSQESWSGPDKIKHFFISAFIESLTFSGLQATGASRNTAFAGAIVTTAAFGIGREVHDKRTKGIFSIPDLGWDAAGAGAAALVLRSTQR